MTTPLLLSDLRRDESLRLVAYPDPDSPLGKTCEAAEFDLTEYAKIPNWKALSGEPWTDGYGNTRGVLPGARITLEQAEADLEANVAATEAQLDKSLPWWRYLCPVRQDALANMAFNLGVEGLLGFHDTLSCLKSGAWTAAAKDVLASKWATEVGERADRIAEMFRTGERP